MRRKLKDWGKGGENCGLTSEGFLSGLLFTVVPVGWLIRIHLVRMGT